MEQDFYFKKCPHFTEEISHYCAECPIGRMLKSKEESSGEKPAEAETIVN